MLSSISTSLLLAISAVVCAVEGISVPTGKKTPITPAISTPRPVYQRSARAPAPVVEYTQENPEPPPLDPSYTPATYKYINALRPNAIYYVPLRLKVPENGVPEIVTNLAKPQYPVKIIDYAVPKRQYFYQEETKPEYHFTRKYMPYKQTKEAYSKEYVYSRQQEVKPSKSAYPKKATAYSDNSKYYYYNLGQN